MARIFLPLVKHVNPFVQNPLWADEDGAAPVWSRPFSCPACLEIHPESGRASFGFNDHLVIRKVESGLPSGRDIVQPSHEGRHHVSGKEEAGLLLGNVDIVEVAVGIHVSFAQAAEAVVSCLVESWCKPKWPKRYFK